MGPSPPPPLHIALPWQWAQRLGPWAKKERRWILTGSCLTVGGWLKCIPICSVVVVFLWYLDYGLYYGCKRKVRTFSERFLCVSCTSSLLCRVIKLYLITSRWSRTNSTNVFEKWYQSGVMNKNHQLGSEQTKQIYCGTKSTAWWNKWTALKCVCACAYYICINMCIYFFRFSLPLSFLLFISHWCSAITRSLFLPWEEKNCLIGWMWGNIVLLLQL